MLRNKAYMKYVILEAFSVKQLQDQINEKALQGYYPVGTLVVDPTRAGTVGKFFYQTMKLEEV